VADQRAVALKWMIGRDRAEVLIPSSVLEILAGRHFAERQAIEAVYLRRAEIESAAAMRLSRRRVPRSENITLTVRDLESILVRQMT
jgi:hypothetical protein